MSSSANTPSDPAEQKYKVELYIYDLSQGMARSLSMSLIGRQIDAIYHTSVVVYGQEYFYGQGVVQTRPGSTLYGVPIQKMKMGDTFIPKDVFDEYLIELKTMYTMEKYHLLNNNCNNFTNDCVNFLVGKNIPAHITSLPQDFISTPFGQMLAPMLGNMFPAP